MAGNGKTVRFVAHTLEIEANAVSDIEMQSFWDTFKKIAGMVAHGVQTGVNIGHGLGLFQAAPNVAPQVAHL